MNTETTYKNPWFSPTHYPMYGPEFYRTEAKPKKYKGFLVYKVSTVQWDVVKDGVCVTQMAGPNGAKKWIDSQEH